MTAPQAWKPKVGGVVYLVARTPRAPAIFHQRPRGIVRRYDEKKSRVCVELGDGRRISTDEANVDPEDLSGQTTIFDFLDAS